LPVLAGLAARHLLAEPQLHAHAAHLVVEAVDQLLIHKAQQALALVYHRYVDAERRKHRRVLGSDDPASDYREVARQLLEVEHVVAVEDRRAIELNVRRPVRPRTHRHHKPLGRLPGRAS